MENEKKPEMVGNMMSMMQNKPLMYGVVAIIVLVIIAIVAIFLTQNPRGGENIGKAIPSDWNTYETDDYVVGYPKDWEVDDSTDVISISHTGTNGDSFPLTGTVSVIISKSAVDTTNEQEKEAYDSVINGNCTRLEELTKESFGTDNLGSDTSYELSSNTVTLNGTKGCRMDFSVELQSFSFNTTNYLFVDGDSAYSLTINTQNPDDPDYDTTLEIIETFNLK